MKQHPNHNRGQIRDNLPTQTDQSQVASTDINIILTQFLRTGQSPEGNAGFYADFTELPQDLRGFIEMGRSITTLQSELPEQLKGIPIQELVAMTNEQINAKLQPADKPADTPKDAPK